MLQCVYLVAPYTVLTEVLWEDVENQMVKILQTRAHYSLPERLFRSQVVGRLLTHNSMPSATVSYSTC